MEGKFHIGCSGYYYSNWREVFYPAGLPAAEWLSYYTMMFDTVEINRTFYRLPRISSLQKYASQTPDDFTFSVKVSKYITHILRLKDAAPVVQEFQTLIMNGLGEKLSCFLFQLPPSFTFTDENLERVLKAIPPGHHNVVEFRNSSWWNDTVCKALTNHGITFCNVDFPGLSTSIINTGPDFYMRFHGNPVLFKSSYTNDALADYLRQMPTDCKKYSIYFNNTFFHAGVENAAAFMEMIARRPDYQG